MGIDGLEVDKSKGILLPTELAPKITEQHITGSFVEIFERYNISRVVSIKINTKIKIKKANFLFVYG